MSCHHICLEMPSRDPMSISYKNTGDQMVHATGLSVEPRAILYNRT